MNRFEHPDWYDASLFLTIDESWIESAEGARLEVCPLEKHENPVLLPDLPWEGAGDSGPRAVHQDPLLGHVVRDLENDRYLLWYNSMNQTIGRSSDPAMGAAPQCGLPGGGSRICFATSSDGLVWEKPDLGKVSYGGSVHNNMIPMPGEPLRSEHLSAVFPTRHAGASTPLAASIYSEFADPVYPRGITPMFSGDGLDWEFHYPPALPLDGDAHCMMWDPATASYLCTTRSAQHTRMFVRGLQRGVQGLNNKRHVALSRSRDLLHWTPMLDILEADSDDPPGAELYQMYIVPYGNVYIGLLQVFDMAKGMTRGPLDIQLAVSRDLERWTRAGGRRCFIPRGAPGSWDSAHTLNTNNPPFSEGGRLRFWYGGKDTEHWQMGNAGLGTGTIRLDGFAKWRAQGEGLLTTRPLDMRWATWPMANVSAPRGSLAIEVIDAETRQPLPGMSFDDFEPVSGDHTRGACRFRGHFGTFWRHTGRVRLRIRLKDAELFALRLPNLKLC